MQDYLEIVEVKAREILDSRGNPTLEAQVTLADGSTGRAAVPSGASTGAFEAVELRDKEDRYNGKGVTKAVQHVNDILSKTIQNEQAHHQAYIDSLMIQEDGTENKGKLGANAILGVSMATACAAAKSFEMPLYQYLGGRNGKALPVPMSNILNGGAHTISAIDFQEFMIMPVGACCFKEGLRMVTEVYHKLKELLDKDGHITAIGDEGGFAPNLKDAFEVFDYLMKAVCEAGYEPGKDIVFAMDAAASELYNKEAGMYVFPGESMLLRSKMDEEEEARPDTEKFTVMRSTEEMIEYYKKLTSKYPLVSIEDGLDEEDWDGWVRLTKELGDHVQLVGDDLFVTNTKRLKKGISLGAANAILIKVNQIGSVTEALDAIEMAHRAGYATVISHRSGETEDTFIADLAVAVNAGQIKTGAPCRSDRVAKYNQLLRIEEELRNSARYENPFEKFK